MKRINGLFWLVVGLISIGLLAGCKGKDGGAGKKSGEYLYRVGFVNIADRDPVCYPSMLKFIDRMKSDELLKKVGVDKIEVLTADSDLNIERQATNVETMLTNGIDIIFIIGVDTEGNTASVEQCNAAGVPVFMVGTEASGGEWKFVGFNETELGRKQGDWCAANLPQNTNICYLQGVPGREATLFREEGFRAGIGGRPDLKVISAQTGMFEVARAMQVTEDWIQAYGKTIGAIVAADGQMITGAIEALKSANMTNDVTTCGVISLGTWDADAIREGVEDYAVFVFWPSIGTLCADIAAEYYLGNEIAQSTYIDLFDVTPTNYTQYMDK
ncbi:putative sugar ABC-transporter, sugar-binding protein [Treponema primitia ZAS-2]|uniref:Putative sugar ABC-transporter, sugar-binding protein n=1 Tax=Treponema primitia (strain ATCC BAA-887 / DSM 12427 / ZAS-2) TaxID=545694 RepID=F5YPH7_TREPZ|nr:sugar ABC transporter substrate-binding protein [Treponema primitia]AEF83707.1 putative sugar ABC-transporter, sugar-binding protein [Treponema primitia ZAS-2]